MDLNLIETWADGDVRFIADALIKEGFHIINQDFCGIYYVRQNGKMQITSIINIPRIMAFERLLSGRMAFERLGLEYVFALFEKISFHFHSQHKKYHFTSTKNVSKTLHKHTCLG